MTSHEDVLNERAKKLACVVEKEHIEGQELHLLFFRLADEVYGIEVAYTNAVHPYTHVTSLPGLPSFMMGVMNVRQQIFSIVDLRQLLTLPQLEAAQPSGKVLLIKDQELEFGVYVDEVFGASKLSQTLIEEIPATFNQKQKTLLLGLTPKKSILINAKALCEQKELIISQVDH